MRATKRNRSSSLLTCITTTVKDQQNGELDVFRHLLNALGTAKILF